MELDNTSVKHILTVVQLLAKRVDAVRVQPMEADALKKNVEALIQQDGNEFVRQFLGAVKSAGGVLLVDPDLIAKLRAYP